MAVFADLALALETARERIEEGPAERRGLAGVAYLRVRRRLAAAGAPMPPRSLTTARRFREAA